MTISAVRQLIRSGVAGFLAVVLGMNPGVAAQNQLVSPGDLQKEMLAATRTRQQNSETINAFLNSVSAKRLGAAHVDVERVKAAVAILSDEELARLASRAEKAQADFAAGRITDRDLLIILVGLAALILIIVAVR